METNALEIQERTTAIATNASEMLTLANTLTVQSAPEMKYGTDILARIKGMIKHSEDARRVLVQPLNEHVAMINAQFKSVTQPLGEAEAIIKRKMLDFNAKVESERLQREARERKEAQDRAMEEAIKLEASGDKGAADLVLDTAAAPLAATHRPTPTTITASGNTAAVRKVWDFEILEFDRIPNWYKVLDDRAVREAVRDGVREIPGIRIFQKDSLAVRGR